MLQLVDTVYVYILLLCFFKRGVKKRRTRQKVNYKIHQARLDQIRPEKQTAPQKVLF